MEKAAMSHLKKQKTAPRKVEWAALRPAVTDDLLADIARRIVEKFQPYKIILFGSYARGTPHGESDVDLLVIMDSEETFFQRIRKLREVAKVQFLPMDIIVHTPAEIEQRLSIGDFFIAEILEKGRVLYQRDSG
ncbi:MAG: nucleotidyltransferase domain-containing protein [Armatimonadota bacterium]|nr:nucleotidyltransferase domain-containing protein [Armatimonadota bacterium]